MNATASVSSSLKLLKRFLNNRSSSYLYRKQISLWKRRFSCSLCCKNKKVDAPKIDLSQFPVDKIRNFSIIAHIDHGKSTLADRLLEDTGVISKTEKNEQVLDRLQVERERGITVKAQSASLFYTYKGSTYLLNLIDTPGHVDFNYEVSRSLSACEGVILLVDANQGVQAQTVANFFLAFELDLPVIPVINKIDLKVARPDVVIAQLNTVFEIDEKDVIKVSAKLGTGVNEVLEAVVERIPPPKADLDKPLRCLMFDTWFKQFKGVVASIAVKDGCIRKGDKIKTSHTGKEYEVQELGIMHPTEFPTDVLYAGQVGYIIANMKKVEEAQVGDTLHHRGVEVEPFPGFKPAKPMVFAGIFPSDHSDYLGLRAALEKLTLNDSSVELNADSSPALGQGWRLGFLGLLHMDVFVTRLDQEYNKSVIVTTPNVPYKVKITGARNIKAYHADELTILNPCHLPDPSMVTNYYEPMVNGTIIAPDDYFGDIVSLCQERRGTYPQYEYISDTRVIFKTRLPLNEILVDFFDYLKSLSSGYASFDYEDAGYEESDLVKIIYLLNNREVEELTMIAHRSRARSLAVKICARLKENIPRQLFKIVVQAAIGSKIICREDILPFRKDVTAKCYGGDMSRKTKLLKQQAEGKKKMRLIGNVEVPKTAFINIIKK